MEFLKLIKELGTLGTGVGLGVLIAAVLIGLVVLVFKRMATEAIRAGFQMDIEQYKTDLKQEADKKMAKLKEEADKELAKFNTKLKEGLQQHQGQVQVEVAHQVEPFKNALQQGLAAYQSKLQEEVTLRIEALKTELAKSNMEFQIHYGKLTDKRFVIIEELYSSVYKLHEYLQESIKWDRVYHVDTSKINTQKLQEQYDKITKDTFYFRLYINIDHMKSVDSIGKNALNIIKSLENIQPIKNDSTKANMEEQLIKPQFILFFNNMEELRKEAAIYIQNNR